MMFGGFKLLIIITKTNNIEYGLIYRCFIENSRSFYDRDLWIWTVLERFNAKLLKSARSLRSLFALR